MIITRDNDCNKITQESWSVIQVNEGLCNSVSYDLSIVNNTCLQLIHIHQNSLLNINSLQLSNLPRLSVFITEANVLYKTNELVLSSKDWVIIIMIDLTLLSIMKIGMYSFEDASLVELNGIVSFM